MFRILSLLSIAMASSLLCELHAQIDGGIDDVGLINQIDDCDSGEYGFSLVIFTSFPSEVSWEVLDENGSVVVSRSDYVWEGYIAAPGGSPRKINAYFCLPLGCYTLNITDSGGDGLGEDGWFRLTRAYAGTVFTGGDFGASFSAGFCTKDRECYVPDYEVLIYESKFEASQGGWLCGFTDGCDYYTGPNAPEGQGAMELEGAALVVAPTVDLRAYTAANFSFSFVAFGGSPGDQVLLEYINAGNTVGLATYTFGVDYFDGTVFSDERGVYATNLGFGEQTNFRFTHISSNPNSDLVSTIYIDDVALHGFQCPNDHPVIIDPGKSKKSSEDASTVTVYPTPSSSFVTVRFPKEAAYSTYSLFDLTGKQLTSGAVLSEQFSLNLSNLPNGVYLVALKGPKGVVTKRVVIE